MGTTIISSTSNTIVQTVTPQPTVILQPQQGVQGIQGFSAYQIAVNNGYVGNEQQWLASLVVSAASTTSNSLSLPSAQILSGQCVVILSNQGLVYADNTIPDHINKVLGITQGVSQLGTTSTIITQGLLNGFSNLIPDQPLYLSTNGQLTQTIPTIGFILQMGCAIDPTTILVSIKTPIQQA